MVLRRLFGGVDIPFDVELWCEWYGWICTLVLWPGGDAGRVMCWGLCARRRGLKFPKTGMGFAPCFWHPVKDIIYYFLVRDLHAFGE